MTQKTCNHMVGILWTTCCGTMQSYGWYFMKYLLWNNEVYASAWGAGGGACCVGACGRGCSGDGWG